MYQVLLSCCPAAGRHQRCPRCGPQCCGLRIVANENHQRQAAPVFIANCNATQLFIHNNSAVFFVTENPRIKIYFIQKDTV